MIKPTDSPRKHVDEVRIPVLMIHGDNDVQVNVEQSEAMAPARLRPKQEVIA